MKASLKATLDAALKQWLTDQDGHEDRPSGLACDGLGEMMGDAAAAVYDSSHAGSIAGANDPASCGVE